MNKSVACIIYDDRKVFIAHRLEKGDMGGRWEFPGGKVEEGESCEDAVKREMNEEFGVPVEVEKRITESRFTHRGEERALIAYKVSFLQGRGTEHFSLTEHSECKWVDIDEIKSLPFVDSDMLIYGAVREEVMRGV